MHNEKGRVRCHRSIVKEVSVTTSPMLLSRLAMSAGRFVTSPLAIGTRTLSSTTKLSPVIELWHHEDGRMDMPPHMQEARDLPNRVLVLEGEAVLEIGSRAHGHRRASTHLRAQQRAWRHERARRDCERQHRVASVSTRAARWGQGGRHIPRVVLKGTRARVPTVQGAIIRPPSPGAGRGVRGAQPWP